MMLFDFDSLPTTDASVLSAPGTTSPVPDVAAQQQQQQQHSHAVLPLDASMLQDENEMPSNDALFNAFAVVDPYACGKTKDHSSSTPSLPEASLFGDLVSPSPGMVNFVLGIDGQQYPQQQQQTLVEEPTVAGLQNLHTETEVASPISFPARAEEDVAAAVQPTPPGPRPPGGAPSVRKSGRARRPSLARRTNNASPGSPPPAGKKGSRSISRPLPAAQHIPRAIPRQSKYAASPMDVAIKKHFPIEVLRGSKDVYKVVLRTHGQSLTKQQMVRLRELRRKELSCVYADNARHRRIGRMAELEQQVAQLEAENAGLRAALAGRA